MGIAKISVIILGLKVFCHLTTANPFVGLVDPACMKISGECPNENVTFWLYTNETRENPAKLDLQHIDPWAFQPRKPVKILIHGYTGHRDFAPNSYIRPILLDKEDVYVISMDYGPLVPYPCYFTAVENLPFASKCLAHLLNSLVDWGVIQNEDIHLIGFSLGAQVAGQTANYLKRKLKRITGLDPAKPMFITVSETRKLDPTDAEFVDVIHTDVLGRGMLRSMGHVDFYPNMGPYQPGCRDENRDDPGSCNHDRAPRYFAESIANPMGFWGYSCASWLHSIFRLCNENSNDAVMGYYVNSSISKGAYFLKTADKSPFALGAYKTTDKSVKISQDLRYYDLNHIDDSEFEPFLRNTFIDLQSNDLDYNEDDITSQDSSEISDELSSEKLRSIKIDSGFLKFV